MRFAWSLVCQSYCLLFSQSFAVGGSGGVTERAFRARGAVEQAFVWQSPTFGSEVGLGCPRFLLLCGEGPTTGVAVSAGRPAFLPSGRPARRQSPPISDTYFCPTPQHDMHCRHDLRARYVLARKLARSRAPGRTRAGAAAGRTGRRSDLAPDVARRPLRGGPRARPAGALRRCRLPQAGRPRLRAECCCETFQVRRKLLRW